MTQSAAVDFLRVILDRAEEIEPPTVDLVRYYVRSGISMPSKRYMLENDVVMVSWDFPFADFDDPAKSFALIVLHKEQEVAPNLQKLTDFLGGAKPSSTNAGDVPVAPLMFHGIFPVRSAGGGTPSRYRVLWSGRREVVSILEQWRIGSVVPSEDPAVIDAQNALKSFVDDLLAYVDTSYGEGLQVTILDPKLNMV